VDFWTLIPKLSHRLCAALFRMWLEAASKKINSENKILAILPGLSVRIHTSELCMSGMTSRKLELTMTERVYSDAPVKRVRGANIAGREWYLRVCHVQEEVRLFCSWATDMSSIW